MNPTINACTMLCSPQWCTHISKSAVVYPILVKFGHLHKFLFSWTIFSHVNPFFLLDVPDVHVVKSLTLHYFAYILTCSTKNHKVLFLIGTHRERKALVNIMSILYNFFVQSWKSYFCCENAELMRFGLLFYQFIRTGFKFNKPFVGLQVIATNII